MEPFSSTSENLNNPNRRRKRESGKYKTNLKVQNFHLQKPFIKNAKSPNVFSNPFFTLTKECKSAKAQGKVQIANLL